MRASWRVTQGDVYLSVCPTPSSAISLFMNNNSETGRCESRLTPHHSLYYHILITCGDFLIHTSCPQTPPQPDTVKLTHESHQGVYRRTNNEYIFYRNDTTIYPFTNCLFYYFGIKRQWNNKFLLINPAYSYHTPQQHSIRFLFKTFSKKYNWTEQTVILYIQYYTCVIQYIFDTKFS